MKELVGNLIGSIIDIFVCLFIMLSICALSLIGLIWTGVKILVGEEKDDEDETSYFSHRSK